MTWKSLSSHREHGGDIDVARERFGRADMIDLSTGISPRSYPTPTLTARRLQALARSHLPFVVVGGTSPRERNQGVCVRVMNSDLWWAKWRAWRRAHHRRHNRHAHDS